MIKLRPYLLILVLCIGMLASGCAGSEEESPSAEKSSGQTSENTAANKVTVPDRQADLTGVVKSVTGNEIVLAVIETPEMPEMPEGVAPNGEAPASGEEKMQPPANAGEGNPPQGGPSQDGNPPQGERPEGSERQPGGRQAQMELTYTGEEVSITVPAGLEIISPGAGPADQDSASSENTESAEIVKGNVLSIWYKDGTSGENAVVESIRVLAQSAGAQ